MDNPLKLQLEQAYGDILHINEDEYQRLHLLLGRENSHRISTYDINIDEAVLIKDLLEKFIVKYS